MRRASLTLRLTLYFGAGSTVVLLLLGWIVGKSVGEHFVEQDRVELLGKVELARNFLARARTPVDLQGLRTRLDDALTGHHHLSLRIAAPDGRVFYDSPGAAFPAATFPLRLDAQPPDRPDIATWIDSGQSFRGTVAHVPAEAAGLEHAVVAVVLDIEHHVEYLRAFNRSLWISIAACTLLTGLLGWAAARRGLAPVRDMTAVAQRVSASSLHDRLAVETLPTELVDLATAFNGMLARLEESFRRLSEFSSDLAHELQTPLANVMTQTQVALSRPRTADEYREVLYSSLEEGDRLARTIADMLFLAKADHGQIVPRAESIDLAGEVHDLFEFYDALVEDRAVRISCTGEGGMHGDRLMMRRALSNLLSNAIAHTPAGGRVEVVLEGHEKGMATIRIRNEGETIPAEHLPRLFDRFYRVDPARERTTGGAGLGLAITKSIVTAHGGTIEAASMAGVTTFEIRMPAIGARQSTTGGTKGDRI